MNSKPEFGDEVEVRRSGKRYRGTFVTEDGGIVVLKLPSGYNIGVKPDGVKVISKRVPEKRSEVRRGSGPPIGLVAAGGTILSRVDYRTGGVYALETPEEIVENVPELRDFSLRFFKPFEKMSEDMDWEDWKELALSVESALRDSEGVVVFHGTDTMGYSSAALSFMFTSLSKPVVFVGSQRSSDRPSSDAFLNILCAVRAALHDMAEVCVCMHGSLSDDFCFLHRGTRVRKMHSSRRDAFVSVNSGPLAKIWADGRLEELSDIRRRGGRTVLDTRFDDRVSLIKVHPGSDPSILELLDSSGFVLEGTGLGHLPVSARKSWIPVVKRVAEEKPVVITTQTIFGRVHTAVYSNLRVLYRTGVIPGFDMFPETAFVKLGCVLGRTKDPEKVREMMTKNLAGEISRRSVP